MANGDELMLSRFTVSGPLITGGHPLQVPDLFIEPGSADFYRGYFGMTSITGLQLGTINIGMNPTSPFALFGAPGSNHILNACLLNVFGDSTFTGNLRVFGGEFRTAVAAATIKAGVVGIFGPKINITGKATNISGALINIAAPGLFIGGREWYSSTKSWDSKKGFDIQLTSTISEAVDIPVIASGGVGDLEHLVEGLIEGKADAVLAASIFHFGTYSIYEAKQFLKRKGVNVRFC